MSVAPLGWLLVTSVAPGDRPFVASGDRPCVVSGDWSSVASGDWSVASGGDFDGDLEGCKKGMMVIDVLGEQYP